MKFSLLALGTFRESPASSRGPCPGLRSPYSAYIWPGLSLLELFIRPLSPCSNRARICRQPLHRYGYPAESRDICRICFAVWTRLRGCRRRSLASSRQAVAGFGVGYNPQWQPIDTRDPPRVRINYIRPYEWIRVQQYILLLTSVSL